MLVNPAIVFTLVWSFTLLLAQNPWSEYYSISYETYLFYLFTVVLFVLSYIGTKIILNRLFYSVTKEKNNTDGNIERLLAIELKIILVICFCILPLYVRYLTSQVGWDGNITLFFLKVRNGLLNEWISIPWYFSNIAIVSSFVAFGLAYLYKLKKVGKYTLFAAVLLTMLYMSLTGARFGVVKSILVICTILFTLDGKVKVGKAIISGFIAIVLLGGLGVVFGRGGSNLDDVQNLNVIYAAFNSVIDYAVNGIILFDNVIATNLISDPHIDIFRFFSDTYHSLFGGLDGNNRFSAPFYAFRDGKYGNVFTMHYYYFPIVGYIGAIFIMVFYGSIYYLIYHFRNKNIILSTLYGALLANLFLSIALDPVLIQLNHLIKMVLFFSLLLITSYFFSGYKRSICL